jgi:hypothetical protein
MRHSAWLVSAAGAVAVVLALYLVAGMHRTSTATSASPGAEAASDPRVPLETERFLYVGTPGVGGRTEYGGAGVLVFDIDNDHTFSKRISLDAATGGGLEPVRGIAAHAGIARLYISTTRRMIALDLLTDQIVWASDFGNRCCDRMALSPDGEFMYVPALGVPIWHVVNTRDGSVITTIEKDRSPHNTIISDDGRFGYLASQGPDRVISVVDTETHEIIRNIGPFSHATRPFTINGRQTLIFVKSTICWVLRWGYRDRGSASPGRGRGLCGGALADPWYPQPRHRHDG